MLNKKALSATAGAPKVFVEDVFSCFLYTGNGSTQTITNNIDLSGEGGLVWCKFRNDSVQHALYDTVRGVQKELNSAGTGAEITRTNGLTSFSSTGFVLGSDSVVNQGSAPNNYVSWTFRKAKKFFDVVTYTGNGTYPRDISHNLGSAPGCIIVKCTSNSSTDWFVYHRSLSVDGTNGPYRILLNSTAAQSTNDDWKNAPTSSVFTVNNSDVNLSGRTYVAYLFAHDAGGFGDAGSDNVITCGSYTGNGSATGPTVTLGYEPQWVLVKRTDSTSNWTLSDNMRGQPVDGATAILNPNLSDAETSATTAVSPTATGFQVKTSGTTFNANGGTYIYIAIRRGPMKTPTSGTSVFLPSTAGATTAFDVGFVPDFAMFRDKSITNNTNAVARLTGQQKLRTNLTNAETTAGAIGWDAKTNFWSQNDTGGSVINWIFKRAPSFFDVVCYTGTGANRTVTHNLGVVPELMIVANRSPGGEYWPVYAAPLGNTTECLLQLTSASQSTVGGDEAWNSTTPTSTVFSVSGDNRVNASGSTYVAYLFASLTGVSKVGSYTGNGSNQTINCGFTGGARFVLIKRTDSTGDWVVFDSARGIVAGNDPALELNTTDAEVTTIDAVDTDNSGFVVNQEGTLNLNVNSASYIFLSIA